MDGEGLAIGLERVNDREELINQWIGNVQMPVVIDEQTDYLFLYVFLYDMRPDKYLDPELTLSPHRQWVEIAGNTYEVFLKREQSGDYVPYPSVLSAYYPDTVLPLMDLTNNELQAMGAGVTSGHLLPADWETQEGFIDAQSVEFRQATGVRFNNAVLKEVASNSPEAIFPSQAVDEHMTYTSGIYHKKGYMWFVDENDYGYLGGARLSKVFPAIHGTSGIRDGKLQYKPYNGFVGTEALHYEVIDAFDNRLAATAYIEVGTSTLPEFHYSAPVAVADDINVQAGATVTLDLLENDVDADGDSLDVHQVEAGGAIGQVILTESGSVEYTAPAYFSGTDQFTYTVRDSNDMVSRSVRVLLRVSE